MKNIFNLKFSVLIGILTFSVALIVGFYSDNILKKQLEIKTKILERTGYDHVMYTESFDGEMAGLNQNYSDMTGIKETLEIKNKR